MIIFLFIHIAGVNLLSLQLKLIWVLVRDNRAKSFWFLSTWLFFCRLWLLNVIYFSFELVVIVFVCSNLSCKAKCWCLCNRLARWASWFILNFIDLMMPHISITQHKILLESHTFIIYFRRPSCFDPVWFAIFWARRMLFFDVLRFHQTDLIGYLW